MQSQHHLQARSNAFHSQKQRLVGHHPGQPPPAWKVSDPSLDTKKNQNQNGSRILLSNLPSDVNDKEVEELFRKTVGPLRDSFLIYDARGVSKGMAVVSFQQPGDAAVARAKYNDKIVDGRRHIKIQIVVDDVPVTQPAPPPPQNPTLLDRLGIPRITTSNNRLVSSTLQSTTTWVPPASRIRRIPDSNSNANANSNSNANSNANANSNSNPTPRSRIRQKKGPRRIRKSRFQLDREIEEYRAAAPSFDYTEDVAN